MAGHWAGSYIRNYHFNTFCIVAPDFDPQNFSSQYSSYLIRTYFDQGSCKMVDLCPYIIFIYGFTYIQMDGWKQSAVFTLSVVLGFLVLAGIAVVLMWLVRRLTSDAWSYLWRQGLANLHRPNNQTNTLIVSIGLGTALISTVFLFKIFFSIV